MKFMVRHLLIFALFFGTLSFTEAVVSNSVTTDRIIPISVKQDTLIPTKRVRKYPTPVSHPSLRKDNRSRTIKLSPSTEQHISETMMPQSTEVIAVCKGNGHFVAGRPRFVSGVFRDTVLTTVGRDSVIVTELSVLNCQSI